LRQWEIEEAEVVQCVVDKEAEVVQCVEVEEAEVVQCVEVEEAEEEKAEVPLGVLSQ
jgi:hypothetical protein